MDFMKMGLKIKRRHSSRETNMTLTETSDVRASKKKGAGRCGDDFNRHMFLHLTGHVFRSGTLCVPHNRSVIAQKPGQPCVE